MSALTRLSLFIISLVSADVPLRTHSSTPVKRHRKIRQRTKRSKEDMFRQVLQSTDTAHNKISVWRETSNEKLRMDTLERRDGQEQMMKLLEDQTEMFKSLITLLSEHIHTQVPLQLIRNSIPCPPQSPHHILSMFPVPHSTPCTQPRGTGFTVKVGVTLSCESRN